MNEAVMRMLARYKRRRVEDDVKALREILQEIALLGLWRSRFFEKAAFYGGTALRILYGMDRYSEDLDFSLLRPLSDFDMARQTPRGQVWKIKIEIDTNPPPGFNTETRFLLQPIPFSVRAFVLPDMFA